MKLNKEICQRCYRKINRPFNYYDKAEWERGRIICPVKKMGERVIMINEEPPKECPYQLEHTVISDEQRSM